MGVLYPRDWCYVNGHWERRLSCSSKWHDWGRWVLLGILIFAAIVLFFAFACISSRRRRRQGLRPYMGTGWTTYYYNNNQPPPSYPPPQYTPAEGYYGQNASYYGQQPGPQQQGVELQPPQNAYRGDNNAYPPPSSPPPAHFGTVPKQ
ncbi:hypothetical protein VTO42DRAFT_244 [Malbranchea cinnamomea]